MQPWFPAKQRGVTTMNFTIQPIQPTFNRRNNSQKNDESKKESGHGFSTLLHEYTSVNAVRSRRDGFAGNQFQRHETPDNLMQAMLHALARVNNDLTAMLL